MQHENEPYSVFKKHYIIPLIACIILIIAGIIMTLLDHSAYGIDDNEKHLTVTGPQTIALGFVLLMLVLFYTRFIYKQHKNNR